MRLIRCVHGIERMKKRQPQSTLLLLLSVGYFYPKTHRESFTFPTHTKIVDSIIVVDYKTNAWPFLLYLGLKPPYRRACDRQPPPQPFKLRTRDKIIGSSSRSSSTREAIKFTDMRKMSRAFSSSTVSNCWFYFYSRTIP